MYMKSLAAILSVVQSVELLIWYYITYIWVFNTIVRRKIEKFGQFPDLSLSCALLHWCTTLLILLKEDTTLDFVLEYKVQIVATSRLCSYHLPSSPLYWTPHCSIMRHIQTFIQGVISIHFHVFLEHIYPGCLLWMLCRTVEVHIQGLSGKSIFR